MVSLIIIFIAIALAAALAVATLYYVSGSSQDAALKMSAGTLINQGQQINASGAMAVAQGDGWPLGPGPAFSMPYLTTMPVPPKSAYVSGEPSATDWTYYVNDRSAYHFVIKNKIKREVCLAVNKIQGVLGIPAAWDGVSMIQCFGAPSGPSQGYTFFFDPAGTASGDNATALALSLTEGGTSTPGYPRLCADGSSINSGLCADTAVAAAGATAPSGPATYDISTIYPLAASGADLWGGVGEETYCSSNAPTGVLGMNSTVTVAGTPVVIDAAYDTVPSMHCVDVHNVPPHVVGSADIYVVNSDGSKNQGTQPYVSSLGAAPTVTTTNAYFGQADVSTTITITGSGFVDGAYAAYGNFKLPTSFIDSQHVSVVMPPAAAFGLSVTTSSNNILINMSNPNSVQSDGTENFRYDPKPIVIENALDISKGGSYGSTPATASTMYTVINICPVDYSSNVLASGGFVQFGTKTPVWVGVTGDGTPSSGPVDMVVQISDPKGTRTCIEAEIPMDTPVGTNAVHVTFPNPSHNTPDTSYVGSFNYIGRYSDTQPY